MTKFIRNLFVVLVVWVVLTFAVYALGRSEDIRLLRGFWPILALLLTCGGSVFCCVSFFVHKPRKDSVIAWILMVVVLIWTVRGAGYWGTWLHFQLYQKQYQTVAQRVLTAESEDALKAICAIDCQVSSTPSLQVGFPYPHFFTAWSEIIYDPSGKISQHGHTPFSFLIRAERLDGNWYFAQYGD
jgi:hypothetical protein